MASVGGHTARGRAGICGAPQSFRRTPSQRDSQRSDTRNDTKKSLRVVSRVFVENILCLRGRGLSLSDEDAETQANVVLAVRLQSLRLDRATLACDINRAVSEEDRVVINLKDAKSDAAIQAHV